MRNPRLRAVLVVSLLRASPAQAQTNDNCPLDATVQSLQLCVQHAAEQGLIDNQGVANSLVAKLEAAENAVGRNQPLVAASQLHAFIREVRAQAGRHINQIQATHMVIHAQAVIHAVEEPS
jgi:hypothetical protein